MIFSFFVFFQLIFYISKVKGKDSFAVLQSLQHRPILTKAAGEDGDVKNEWALQKALVIYMQKQTLPILYLCP